MTAACINPLRETPPADRILVIRLGALGDVIRTLPAFGELRELYPQAHLAWLVEPKAEAAVRGQPGVDETIVFPRDQLEERLAGRHYLRFVGEVVSFARSLRQRNFDLVVDFHAILKSGLLARATGAPIRLSYARPFSREGAGIWASHRARIQPARVPRYVRNAGLVDFLAVDPPSVPRAEAGQGSGFKVDAADRARMRDRLGVASRPLALMHPGTSAGTPYKRYPVESWARVARDLAVEGFDSRVAAGDAVERSVAEAIVAASGGRARLAPETDSLGELAALAEASDLFLGSDSGPLHLASLVGTPVVQLLGPTDPVENRPWPGTPARAVRVPIGCSPCRSGCAAAACMTALPPSVVVEAALGLVRSADLPDDRGVDVPDEASG